MEPITVQATINAPIEVVWQMWTLPEHITQWCFASDDWYCPAATNDPRTGGQFSSTMAAKDGSFSFDFGGVYDEVITNQLIKYTLDDGRKVSITFSSDDDDQTTVTETFDPETQNPIEMQRGGWQAIMDNFKKHVEGN
ncbi:SRPBCC family protein [Mucilaginibacter sp. HMF5004]|uniref:SRPBCC family protein n=1 Tax=Mucilaginibacter rivuli TaxID=2857527 RepID=UPI001C5DA196|nr:SRPBCC family protein [Mucilaginibacter rivuli]MBW4891195.1 SRPBCC family protein [Mucilaginibacter rivuli]